MKFVKNCSNFIKNKEFNVLRKLWLYHNITNVHLFTISLREFLKQWTWLIQCTLSSFLFSLNIYIYIYDYGRENYIAAYNLCKLNKIDCSCKCDEFELQFQFHIYRNALGSTQRNNLCKIVYVVYKIRIYSLRHTANVLYRFLSNVINKFFLLFRISASSFPTFPGGNCISWGHWNWVSLYRRQRDQ